MAVALTHLHGQSIGVFGLARSGMATVRAAVAGGARVFAWDDRESARQEAERLGAQAVRPDGALVDDFLFVGQGEGPGAVLHVLNAPSPAATAALPIGREILTRLTGEKLGPL